MEVSVNHVGKNIINNDAFAEQVPKNKELAPVLNGSNVNVITASDFQKLLAELQAKAEEKKQAAALNVLSNELGRLVGIATGLEEGQKKTLVELEVETKKLEALVKAYTKTADDRKQEQLKKSRLEEQRTRLETKISELDKQIEKEEKAAVVDTEKVKQLKAAKEQTKTELGRVEQNIGEAETKIADFDKVMVENSKEQSSVQKAINAAVGKLNSSGLSILCQAIRSTATQVVSATNALLKEKLEEEEASTGQEDIVGIFSEILEKKTEDMRDEISSKHNEIV